MKFLRNHWYDLGGFFSIIILGYVFLNYNNQTNYQILMWLSLISLFFHQIEEYRIAATFPGMLNTVMYKSQMPDRYPLNPHSAFCINVFVGWSCYLLAAIFGEKAISLGIATMLVSVGNIIAHTFLFNIKGKTIYNAGLATCLLLFVPCVYFFIMILAANNLATITDYLIGIPLGIGLNVFGVLKLIDWMADKNTSHVFSRRNLLSSDRLKNSTEPTQ